MSRHPHLAGLCLLLAVATAPSSARAYACISSSCPRWCTTADYGLSIVSADLGEATTVAEVQRAMNDWGLVSCSSLETLYTGIDTSRVAGNTRDDWSGIGWVESGWSDDPNAIGVTGPQWDGRNCIQNADMQMNGVNFTWITGSGRGSQVNAYSITLHEGGHYYGLGHSNDSGATMYFAYTGGIDSIGSDDQNGICNLYPGGGGGTTTCEMSGCPSGQECVSGSCRTIVGDGSVCSPCSSHSDCGGSNDYCLTYPDGRDYCGKVCSSSADCSGSQQCYNVGGIGQCVVVSGCAGVAPSGCSTDSDCSATQVCNTSTRSCEAAPTGGADLGAACTASEECNSGLCATLSTGSVCSRSCDWLDTGSCPGGFYCDGEATGVCGTGLCIRGTAGARALGEGCSADTDCATLMCDRGVCSEPCIPGGATACPAGLTCQTAAAAGCGACKMAGGIGAPCSTNNDCASSLCATRAGDDGSFCTAVCSSAADCPGGFTCERAGEVSVCAPPADGGGPPAPGSVGADCASNAECNSGLCTVDGFCTAPCTDASMCPATYACTPTSDRTLSVCTPRRLRRDSGGCGCVVPGAGASGSPWLLLLVLPLAARLRRRRR